MAAKCTEDPATALQYKFQSNSGAHGNIYQRDLAFLMFVRATLAGYRFKLATEMQAAGKFDDVVVYVQDLNQTWLLQAKHADASKASPVSEKELFPWDERWQGKDFDLSKYVKSYLQVRHDVGGDSDKRYFMFTNRSLASLVREWEWIQIVPSQVERKVLDLSDYGGVYRLFVVQSADMCKLLPKVNVEFYKFVDALKNLFTGKNNDGKSVQTKTKKSNQIEKVLLDYKTGLRTVLTAHGNKIKFSDEFLAANDETSSLGLLHRELRRIFPADTDLTTLECEKIDVLLSAANSRNTNLPSFIGERELTEFFRDLVMCVNQPNDLWNIADSDLRLWLRSVVRPDVLGRFGVSQWHHPVAMFEQAFKRWHDPDMKGAVACEYKAFLDSEAGFKCLSEVIQELEQHMPNLPEVLKRYYVSREIDCGNSSTVSDKDWARQLTENLSQAKCIALIGEPGMGKTTAVQYVSFEAQKATCETTPYLIYVRDIKDKLDELQESPKDLDNTFDVLKAVLSEQSCVAIRQNDKSKTGRIMFFLDGFDEALPSQFDKLIAVCGHLLTMDHVRLVISGRKHVLEILQTQLKSSIQLVHLVPFKNKEQTEFLRKFWNVSMEENDTVAKFRKYADLLLQMFHRNISRSQYDFTGLPLMLRMLAEVYAESFERFSQSADENYQVEELSRAAFSVIALFEQFVKKSFCMKILKKFDLDPYTRSTVFDEEYEPMFNVYISEHQLAAIKQLNIKELEQSFREHSTIYEKFSNRVREGKEKSLLINIEQTTVQFVHLSFAEYFAALYLNEYMSHCKQHLVRILKHKEVVRRFFFMLIEERLNDSSEQLSVLDEICARDTVVAFWACEAVCLGVVKVLLSKRDLRNEWIEGYGTLLHVAILAKSRELVEFLLDEYLFEIDIFSNDGIALFATTIDVLENLSISDRVTSLHLACRFGYSDMVELLLDHGANVDAHSYSKLTPLHVATRNGFAGIVEKLIKHKADVEAQDERKQTPLHLAARFGQVNIVKLLMKHSTNANATDAENNTAINMALEHAHVDVAEFLVEEKVDVNVANCVGSLPLHTAVKQGLIGMVRSLLNHTVDVNTILLKTRQTPLHIAAEKGHAAIVELLIQNGAKVDALSQSETPLSIAAAAGHLGIVEYLIAKLPEQDHATLNETLQRAVGSGNTEIVQLLLKRSAEVNTKDSYGSTPLHNAASRGHTAVVKLLLDHSADTEAPDVDGNTPLHLATRYGFPEVVIALLKMFANPNAQNNDKMTALHIAASSNGEVLAHELLKSGADMEARDDEGQTALHLAARYNSSEVANLLISRSADKNAQNMNLDTPLHLAIRYHSIACVESLLEHSARLDIKNKKKWTPLHVAAYYKLSHCHCELLEKLLHPGSLNSLDNDKNTPLHLAVEKKALEIVTCLLSHSANVNIQNKTHRAPLHLAAASGSSQIVTALLTSSARTDLQDSSLNTPLHLALAQGHTETAQLLIPHSSKLDVPNKLKLTALHLAARSGYTDLVQLLVDRDVHVNAQDKKLCTPLHLAVRNGHIDVVRVLMANSADRIARQDDGKTPLQLAIQYGKLDIVTLLESQCAEAEQTETRCE